MESPVVIDKPPEYHGNPNERGFPFDEEEGSGAWSSLAARHPDIAARLRSRPATWARKRRPSSQDATDDFGDNFSGFDRFPFDDIPPEFREHFPSHWNRRFDSREDPQTQAPPQPQPQQQQQQPPSPQQQTTSTQTEQDPGPSTQTQLPQYGLRNTVDLGQKSAVDPSLVDADDRNQRSMSAPPSSCTANQSNTPKMSAQNHQEQGHPPQHSEHQQHSNVRHIPIFVEGRDEPVINKNVDHGTHFGETKPAYAPPPPQPHIEREQYFADDGPAFHSQANFPRTFGTPFNKGFRQGPQPFVQQKVYPQTAFARGASPQRSQSPKSQAHPEEHFVKVPVHHEHAAPKPEPQPRPQQKQQQQQQPPQQPQQPPQQPPPPKEQTPPPQPKQQPSPNDPITQILSIQTDVLNLMTDVENFTGSKKDKRYLFLDEMLTRNLIKLDNIETDGKENIRQARKEAIRCIQKCIAVLEAKAEKGGSTPQPRDVEMQENTEEAKENEDKVAENGVEVEMKEAPKEENVEQPQAAAPQEEKKEEAAPQEAAPQAPAPAPEPEVKEAAAEPQPQAADTRPEEPKASEAPEEKKAEEVVDKKASPKKGTKNVKKRDKSKDKKEVKDSNKEQKTEEQKTDAKAEVMQVDDKGDKTETQAMDVDGAASQ